jgi:anti-anti-sigma factor
MIIKVREKEKIAILDLEGNIDINASDFIEKTGEVLNSGYKNILCNFGGVNLIDYVGISVIAIVYKNIINHRGNIKLYNVPSHVKRLFSIVGLDRVLECYETEEQALNSFKEDKIISEILKKKLRRRFKRIPTKKTIEYRQKFSQKDIFYKGKIINLSAIGVFMIGKKVFSIGDILTTKLYLTPSVGIIEVDAKVIWTADKYLQKEESPGMGLEFYKITPQIQEKIIQFVEKNLSSL